MAEAKRGGRGHGPQGHSFQRPKDFRGTVSKLLRYIGRYKASLVVVFICLVISSVGSVMSSYLLKPIINDYILPGDFPGLIKMLCLLGGAFALSGLCSYAYARIMVHIAQNTVAAIRRDLFNKMQSLPLRYFDTHQSGDLMSRFTNDIDTISEMINSSFANLISCILTFLGTIGMMLYLNWVLTLITFAFLALMLLTVKTIGGRSRVSFQRQQAALGAVNGYVEEMYSGHEVVRISRAEAPVGEKFDTLNDAVYDANWRSQFLSGIMQPLMNVIGNLSYVAVCVLGSILALQGIIDIGVIVSFILYVRLFTSPLSQIAQGMTNLQTASASAHRIFDFLASEELPDEQAKPQLPRPVRGAVDFEHVRFSYPDSPDKIIIKDFSAHVAPGQKVAIVGPTGAGKTTMVNLLMRFFEVNSGRITIDGVATTDLRREDVHKLFGMVLQDTWLFEGTIRENLVYNMEGITDEQLETVCKACGLDKFVHSLPQGFDTVLSESTTISAGQKQLLTIARAMLQNAPMLILDEATSSVDTRTELLIQRAMDELTKGRTSFVIAHRLSTIKNADLILVMRDGDVIESGTHEQLMEQNGFYAELYNSQFAQAS